MNGGENEIEMYADDRQKIKVMKNHGFTCKCHCENKRIYELDKMDLAYDLRPGYRIVTLYESGNIHIRVALVQKVFDDPGFSIKNVEGLSASPDYNSEYDLTVIDENSGMHVAYCIGWKDNRDPSLGYLEPVGTHPDFRKRGLAKALLTECFSRLYKAGITRIKIASEAEPNPSNYFFDSLKPSSKMEVHKYGHCP